MRRSSSTWLSRIAAALLSGTALVTGAVTGVAARPWPCLPPVFDGGQRLHALPAPRIFWLDLLLRQHELCWRSPTAPGELRVALFGNSAVYGLATRAEQTFGGLLNQHFAADGVPAHLYNLAFVVPYQVRDAVIIHEMLAYDPDVFVYPITLADFFHVAPLPYPLVVQFFERNRGTVAALANTAPIGLAEPFKLYGASFARHPTRFWWYDSFREAGAFLRLGAQAHAQYITERITSPAPLPSADGSRGGAPYDCQRVKRNQTTVFRNWETWNILAYLQHLRETRHIEVLIINWPVSHEPIDECYNAGYTNDALAEYDRWLADEVARRGLHYLDLQNLLPPGEFIDSRHVTAAGHQRIAEAVARTLDPLLRDLAKRPPETDTPP